MSNVGMKEVYCSKCGILYTAKSIRSLREIILEHKEDTNHDSIIRTVYSL